MLNTDLKIVTGDFHLEDIDKKRGVQPNVHTNSLNTVKAYMNHNNLIDVWRFMNPDNQVFTWKRLRPQPIFVRLDYFLISERIFHSVEKADIIPG